LACLPSVHRHGRPAGRGYKLHRLGSCSGRARLEPVAIAQPGASGRGVGLDVGALGRRMRAPSSRAALGRGGALGAVGAGELARSGWILLGRPKLFFVLSPDFLKGAEIVQPECTVRNDRKAL